MKKKTHDLEEENRVRRAAEARLHVLNERQRALVDASVRFVPRPFLEFLGALTSLLLKEAIQHVSISVSYSVTCAVLPH